jgi:DNA-binding winged helix-turn-helix (wHTH) protein
MSEIIRTGESAADRPNRRRSDGQVLAFADYVVNAQTGELRKAGRQIRIQEKPFQILSVLMQRAGEMVSRRELREELWASGTYVSFDHCLNVAVAKMRRVLGDPADTPRFIQTIASRGYRFIAPVRGQNHTGASLPARNVRRLALVVLPFHNITPSAKGSRIAPRSYHRKWRRKSAVSRIPALQSSVRCRA